MADAGEFDALLRKATTFERCTFDDAELWELDVPETRAAGLLAAPHRLPRPCVRAAGAFRLRP